MQPPQKIDSSLWTLRFKQHKTTILLYAYPGQSFTSIKKDLLDAISSTGLKAIDGHDLPSDPEDVILGVPIDKNDIDRGWKELLIPEADNEIDAHKSKKVKKDSIFNSSPLGAGLKDGAMIAFRFKADEEEGFDVIMPTYEDDATPGQMET